MKTNSLKTPAALCLLLVLAAQNARAVSSGVWSATGSMSQERYNHSATLLPSGNVMVAGGWGTGGYDPLTSVEIYNSAAGTWSAGAALSSDRYSHTATLLPNGNVLVVAGIIGGGYTTTAAYYNPTANSWTATGSLTTGRGSHTATPLQNGRVLVAGGGNDTTRFTSAELYNTSAGTWSATGSMAQARAGHTATLLSDGRVLVTGGFTVWAPDGITSCELYDPNTGAWSAAASMGTARYHHSAVLLSNGKVLVAGGGQYSVTLSSSEVYDPGTNTWTTLANLNQARSQFPMLLLGNGKALAIGGSAGATLSSVEIFDPATSLWSASGSMSVARGSLAAVRLANSNVLAVGGHTTAPTGLTSAELYGSPVPLVSAPTGIYFDEVFATTITASGYAAAGFSGLETGSAGVTVAKAGAYAAWRNGNVWATKAAMTTPRFYMAVGVIGGKLYAVGGSQNNSYETKNEEYDPVSDTWSTKTAIPTARHAASAGVVAAKLYVVGGWNGSSQVGTNHEYDPVSNTWSTKTAMPTGRSNLAAGVIGGKLYAVGGTGGLTANEEYDPAANTWATKTAMPTAREALAAGVIGGKLYAVGGGAPANTNEEYDPATNAWITKAVMPTARGFLAAGVIGGKLYAVGGQDGGGILAVNEEYDPASNAWSSKASMPTARGHFSSAAGVIGGKLYAAGGVFPTGVNTNEEYDPGVAHSFGGLTPNTQYAFKAKARDASGNETVESAAVSTYTAAAQPLAAADIFTPRATTSLTANWLANGNPVGTLYRAQLSASSNFASATTSDTYNTSAAFTGLTSGSTYYARVLAINALSVPTNYTSLSSTPTTVVNSAMTTPTGVYFDDISSTSIVASGYVASGFTGLETGSAGVNVAKDGTYATWRNGNIWTSKTGMPTGRGRIAAAATGGKMYVFGGWSAGTVNEEYDPVANNWASKASMPTSREWHTAAASGGKIYVLGGNYYSGSYTYYNANEEYDPAANSWATKAAMPTVRDALAAAAVGGKIYAIGGTHCGAAECNMNEEYDPAANTWSAKAVMPTARHGISVGVINGKVYVVGGHNGSAVIGTNEEYNPASNTWATKATMPTVHNAFTAAAVGGKLYAMSGQNSTNLNVNEEYDPVADQWVTKAVVPTIRGIGPAAVAISGKIYIAGGDTGSYLTTNEEYDPGVAHSFGGLTPNTQYAFKAKARDSAGIETAETSVVSTYTLAAIPAAAVTVFTPVYSSSLTVNWLVNGNPAGTLYRAQISASSAFSSVTTSNTYNTNAVFTGLTTGTPYYARVAAINGNGIITSYAALGSTTIASPSAMTAPTGVYFDEISSTTIVASGYAAAGFTGLQTGSAGVNVAKDGTYSTWRNGNLWASKTGMSTARRNAVTGVIGGKMYVAGGYVSGYTAVTEEYDPVANAWTSKASMPGGRAFLSGGVISNKLYAMGGFNGSNVNANTEYDPVANSWSVKTAIPTARIHFTVGAVGGKLYAIGGYDSAKLNVNEEYDPVLNTWSTKAVMPTARYYLSPEAGVVGNKIYVAGGTTVGSDALNVNQEYDPAANSWSTKAVMPVARKNLGMGAIGGKVYAIGGVDNSSNRLNTNEEYDPASNTWTTKAVMSTPRCDFMLEALNGKFYAVGGENGSLLTTNEMYDPGVAHSFTGLTPNTQYSFKAKARDSAGIETAETSVVSTYTLAAQPIAASTIFTSVGATAFTANWQANGNPSGTLYRAQISASSAFTSVTTSNTYGTSVAFTGLTTNTLYYVLVAAINGNGVLTEYLSLGSVTATAGNNAPTLAWTGEIGYTADGLNPETGASTTTFVYRVKYTDINNDAPATGYPQVHITKGGSAISGSPFLMTYVSGSYTTGALYTYSRTLAASGSDYSYYFAAKDAPAADATGSPTGAVDAPDVSDSITGDRQEGFNTTLGDNLFSPRSGGTSKIKFNVSAAGKVSLKIYDISGRLVRTLYEGDAPAGNTQRDWDGRDDSGRYVIPSVYFLHYVHSGGKEVRRIGVRK